ncbi:MAG: sugar ABC transporter substrate-binding protein [Candidatus Omnitrophica bacterium]|nr:sugar ABC transporter substrate-binding protein [Candidatus Omnitrophota bacterium]
MSYFALSLLLYSGCGQKQEEAKIGAGEAVEIKVAFWGSPEEIEIVTESMADWQKAHPNISVRFEHTPYTGYDSKILTRIAGGAAPDVIAAEVNYFVTFATKGVFTSLTPFIKGDPEFSFGDFFPSIMDRFTVGGEVYALPRDVAPFACVFYNKDLFDQANIPYPSDDWTWDDLLKTAQALTMRDASGRITQYGFYGWAWQNFIYGNGGSLVDDVKAPTKTTLDDPKSIDGLQFYADLINKYQVMPTPLAMANLGMGVDMMFASGRLAMFLSGIWETPALRTRYSFRWDVAMFPKNREGVRHFGSGGTGYGILRSSKHPDEAWEVVKALTSAPVQAELAKRGLAQPSLRSVAMGGNWALSEAPPANKKMLNEAVNDIVFDPFHPKWREIEAKFILPELDLVKSGKETAQEAVQKITPQINQMFQGKGE